MLPGKCIYGTGAEQAHRGLDQTISLLPGRDAVDLSKLLFSVKTAHSQIINISTKGGQLAIYSSSASN